MKIAYREKISLLRMNNLRKAPVTQARFKWGYEMEAMWFHKFRRKKANLALKCPRKSMGRQFCLSKLLSFITPTNTTQKHLISDQLALKFDDEYIAE
ncbi:hypothetical protein TNCV_2306931 [Trichonephila clavipes]|nr:hypothetical protein TNCV_2306931 [Trichonephila clavipes]